MNKTYSIIPDCCLGANISDPCMKMLWIELYAMANFGETELLHRGQLSTTYHEICQRTALTLKQVRNRIDMLVKRHQLVKQKTNQGIVLTIVNYDKNINGKGRRRKSSNVSVSIDYANDNSQKGNQMADNGAEANADTNICHSMTSENHDVEMGIQKGIQNEENDAHYITIRDKRDVVVKEDNNSNNSSSVFPSITTSNNDVIRQKKLRFKNEVLVSIDAWGWKQHLDIPEFKDSVQKYLEYYGACTDGITLSYETIKGFTIDCSLHKWIRNENALRPVL